jgi:hypothetical protein
MFTRSLPEAPTAALDFSEPVPEPEALEAPAIRFRRDQFPMIDSVEILDFGRPAIQIGKTLSVEKDIWLEDHRPFSPSQAPLLSGVMTIEAFAEASTLLFPYLTASGVRDLRFLEAVECAPDTPRFCRVRCDLLKHEARRAVLQATLTAPGGQQERPEHPCARGQILMEAAQPDRLPELVLDHTIQASDGSTLVDDCEMTTLYSKNTGFGHKYRVLHNFRWSREGAASGVFVESENRDSSDFGAARYAYSPYLLEAIMHLAGFFAGGAGPDQARRDPLSVAPAEIDEILWRRKPLVGEMITVRTFLKRQAGRQFLFDGSARDTSGTDIMQVRGLCMVTKQGGDNWAQR